MKTVWRWVIIIGGALLAAALLGAGLLAYLVSRVDVRAEVERVVENATGRDLTIAGDVGVTFWPVLGLRAANASLSNVEGGRAADFIAMDELDVGVELRPLLDRQIVVQRLVLQRPRIALEVNEQGRPNWILSPRVSPLPTPPPPSQQGPVDVSRTTLREVRIVDGEASFFDARLRAGWVAGEVDLRTALEGLDRPMRAEGSFRYNGRPVEITLEMARPRALTQGQLTPIKLTLEGDLLSAAFDGQTIATSGELAGLVRVSGPSLRQLAVWTGAPIQGGVGMEAFAVTGRLAVGRGLYDFSNAAFQLDRIQGRGDFTLSQGRGKPYLSGRLELFDFDLNPYITGQAPAPASEAVAAAAIGAEPRAIPAPTAEIAAVAAPPRALDVQQAPSTTPINFSGLQALNADLELVTHAVLVQHMRVDGARLNLVINDGFLAATIQNVSLYGGSGRGRMEIDARDPQTRIVQEFAFEHLDARRFLTDAINFSNIEGTAELSFNLRTRGRTQSELIAAADGGAHLEILSGVLHGVDLGGVSRTIRNALRGELIAPEARTAFLGFSATFAIADGVVASENLSFNTTDLRIPGIGVIDLAQRRLDLRLSPRSPRGGLTFPFSIRGPWGQFAYRYDGNNADQRAILARVREVQAASRAPAN